MSNLSQFEILILVLIAVLFLAFYVRRFWFWFWKVNKLLTQFELVMAITEDTNQEVKRINTKVEELLQRKG